MNVAIQDKTIQELIEQRDEATREMLRRRSDFVARMVIDATITREQASEYAERGRSAFALPIGDWALVKTVIAEKRFEMAKRGCIQFWPIVMVTEETQSEEYRELFGKDKP